MCSVVLFMLVVNLTFGWTSASVYVLEKGRVPTVTSALFHNKSAVDITNVTLNSCAIKVIDEQSFHNLSNLRHVRVTNNPLEDLAVGTFRDNLKLRSINLNHNKIRTLKNGVFANLVDLLAITLHNNRLESIEDKVFEDMHLLRVLDLGENRISALHRNIFSGNKKLQRLNIEHNVIEQLNENTFKNLRDLEILYMRGNQITVLDKKLFSELYKLVRLEIQNNAIGKITMGTFSFTRNLGVLKLSHNKLSHIYDNTFTSLTKLRILHLQNNSISYIGRYALPNSTKFAIVHLGQNKLQNLDSRLVDGLKPLFALSIDGNPWICDCGLQLLYAIWRNHSRYGIPWCAEPEKLQFVTWDKITSSDFCPKSSNYETGCALQSGGCRKEIDAVVIGDTVTYECRFYGRRVKWFYRSKMVQEHFVSASGQNYSIRSVISEDFVTSRLTIMDVRLEDNGVYTCRSIGAEPLLEKQFILEMSTPEINSMIFWVIIGFIMLVILVLLICVRIILFIVLRFIFAGMPEAEDVVLEGDVANRNRRPGMISENCRKIDDDLIPENSLDEFHDV